MKSITRVLAGVALALAAALSLPQKAEAELQYLNGCVSETYYPYYQCQVYQFCWVETRTGAYDCQYSTQPFYFV